jgi:CrcB protein
MLSMINLLAVAGGGLAGSVLRWLVSIALNPLFPALPLGTLAVNVTGGFGIGIALAWFIHHPSVAPETRLLITSGFFGGYTTFSAFSAEVVGLAVAGRAHWALATVAANVLGALLATWLGMKALEWVVR